MAASPIAFDPEVVRQGLTRAQYDAMVEAGLLDGEPVQLIEGELVRMAPQGWEHARSIDLIAMRLGRGLTRVHGDRCLVRQEKPLAVTDDSEPEPDVAVVDAHVLRGRAHPSWAHLVVEVSDSSRRLDRLHKPRVYALGGIPLYWVVDLVARRVVVHRHPIAEPPARYASVEEVSFDSPLSVLEVTVTMSELLD
jgi:Uma2 family endonuclease